MLSEIEQMLLLKRELNDSILREHQLQKFCNLYNTQEGKKEEKRKKRREQGREKGREGGYYGRKETEARLRRVSMILQRD